VTHRLNPLRIAEHQGSAGPHLKSTGPRLQLSLPESAIRQAAPPSGRAYGSPLVQVRLAAPALFPLAADWGERPASSPKRRRPRPARRRRSTIRPACRP
jgi:hypothetical protein